MPAKINPSFALPARMDLAIDSLSDANIAVLMFPFAKEVKEFCQNLEKVFRNKQTIYAPYRQLNNAILACSSTLTHGFEYLETVNYIPQYRALAVGTGAESSIPTPEQIHELIYIWAQTWIKQSLEKKGQRDEIQSVCDRFLEAIDKIPEDWQWEFIALKTLIKDLNAQNGLGYQAIPSLLVTLLHEQTCTISSGDMEQTLKWRKVQGGSSTRTGLHLVSQPFKATYFEEDYRKSGEKNAKEKEGYFAYRLDFYLHTQAGRFHTEGHLKPWVFIHLSCQRYAHEPLVDANHGRDISILMGMNQARLDKYPIDSTLVRLTIENQAHKNWQEQLPDLLTEFKARALVNPQEILNNPRGFGNLDDFDDWNQDEYYIVHAEGYEYKQEGQKGRGHGHSIKTGFSLTERADITNQILQLLNPVLIPDRPMEFDIPVPAGKKLPLAMSDYDLHHKSLIPSALKKITGEAKQQYIKDKQNVIARAIKQTTNDKEIYLFIVYYEEHTKTLVCQQLRQAFLLQDGDEFPAHINVIDVFIHDSSLLEKLRVSGLPSVNPNFDEEIKKQHQLKRQAWQKFFKEKIVSLLKGKHNCELFAIIEIGTSKVKGIHPQQSIRGAVREACVLENINSQMLQTVKANKPKDQENSEDHTTYSKADEGRVLNAILDVTLRQTGTLYGLPSEVYKVAGIPENFAQKLDVIAFCRLQKNNFIGKTPFQYAVAVRLSAGGTVDVLLPHQPKWVPYSKAGIAIGQLFHQVRKARNTIENDRKIIDLVQMKGGQLVKFVADVLSQHLENPTIALIEADVWRNERTKDGTKNEAWFQLKNEYLFEQKYILNFERVPGHNCQYPRDDKNFENLLGVVRIRSNHETPQYVTNRKSWDENSTTSDFTELSGFIDKTVPEFLHYFSVGKIPSTQKNQKTPQARELYKSDRDGGIYAANISYKHQQMLEMLPFFVRRDFQTEDNLKALCRVPHFLRISPAFTRGNISHPYPMHLGIKLIEDFLCILYLEL
ncbi:pPIWI_RE module domain-containing protein [Microcoleus sp. herbarium5]|uniref:pPIWI_RE module domain-containing protein n=1 Tax=Microcoleus sp. herbarium5 TaxID=3055434 RepID=UPI002FD45638